MDFFEKLGRRLNLEDEEVQTASVESEFYTPEESPEDTEEAQEETMEEQGMEEYAPYAEGESLETQEEDNDDENSLTPSLAMAKTSSKANVKNVKPATPPSEEGEVGRLTIDVYENEDEIVVKSIIAGVNTEDLDINITSDSVSIRGERSHDEEVHEENYFYQECFWGAFSRSVILPTEIDPDKADATLDNGILTIKLPKLTKTQQKKLKVKKVS